MRPNAPKQKVAEGGVSLGTMVFEFASSGIGRLSAAAGAEFIIYDMEHTGWSIETIRGLMATTRAADIVPMVRVPATEYHLLARPLDVGAMGLMVPMVESVAQAEKIVSSAKYPPQGRRGAAFTIAHDDYAGGDIVEKMTSANHETLLMAQIETVAGVAAAREIAAIDGIDVLWVGHFDLSASLGVPGQFDHPDYLRAIDRVLEACAQHGKTPGIMAGDVAMGRSCLAQGFRMVAYGGDLWLYQRALQEGIDALRG